MKSMTKLIVVAMILAAALVVAPVAAARTITVNGTAAYVGEEQLTLGGAVFAGATELRHYTGDPGKSSTDKTIPVSGGVISELVKGIPTGSYYAVGWALPIPSDLGAVYINIQNPEATLDVMLNSSVKDSVNGKSITRGTGLDFKFYSNVGDLGVANANRTNVELTLPGGGVVTTYNGTPLRFDANGQTQFIHNVIIGDNAAAGTYSAIAKWSRDTDFFGKGFDSKAVTFEVLSKALGITANKDSVVRGNSFAVTITGESRENYTVLVKSGSNNTPLIIPGQTAVNYGVPTENDWNRTVKTNAGGTATVQFNTTADGALKTEDKTYTIRVQEQAPGNKYDEVKVKVEAGSVTLTTSGTGTYYIGEEITLSGTCTEGDRIYFFMTGPNLNSAGVNLTQLGPVTDNVAATFDSAEVNADDTWSKKWDTGTIGKALDAGGYTIYAVSNPRDKDHLSNAKYATASINLRSGFITATTSGATVAKGDKLTISGTAQGNPSGVRIWIFGKNYYGEPNGGLAAPLVNVESDGSFKKDLKSADTKLLAAGQYFVIIQHPMGGNFGVLPNNPAAGWINGSADSGISAVKIIGLQAPAAASALINMLDSPNIPDTYVKLTFVVAEPNLFIDPIGTKTAGGKFTVSGTTNLAVGDTLNIDVTSAAFQPGQKTEASGFSSAAGTVTVQKGDGANKWSFEVDGTSFKPDQYIVKVESIEAGTTATATFNVVAGAATTQPTGNVTTQPTGNATTTTTAAKTPTAAPTTTPGFGALVALTGLGAVAFLVLRRK